MRCSRKAVLHRTTWIIPLQKRNAWRKDNEWSVKAPIACNLVSKSLPNR